MNYEELEAKCQMLEAENAAIREAIKWLHCLDGMLIDDLNEASKGKYSDKGTGQIHAKTLLNVLGYE